MRVRAASRAAAWFGWLGSTMALWQDEPFGHAHPLDAVGMDRDLDALPASAVLVLAQQALRRSESRRDFFAALPSLLPTSKIPAGSAIVDSVAAIVLRSDRWTL